VYSALWLNRKSDESWVSFRLPDTVAAVKFGKFGEEREGAGVRRYLRRLTHFRAWVGRRGLVAVRKNEAVLSFTAGDEYPRRADSKLSCICGFVRLCIFVDLYAGFAARLAW
jgi:hypothetical protein